MKNQKRLDNKGFSLVELIVVIAIMAVLMGVLAPTLIGNIEKSRESTDLQNLDTIRGAAVTAMTDEAVNREIMQKITGNEIAISLGDAKSAGAGQIDSAYANFKAEMESILTSSVAMKCAEGTKANCKVYVVINKNGGVTALIATSDTDAKALKAATCSKTKNEAGNKKPLLSGVGATS